MLTILIRLMGAWLAVYGLLFGFQFTYMLKTEAPPHFIFLAFLPSIASMIIGIIYIIYAPKISGDNNQKQQYIPNILRSGLILLGVYWLGTGMFYAIGNVGFYNGFADSSRFDIFDSTYWVAAGNFFQVIAGMTLIIIGNRMQKEVIESNQ